jgi:3-oxoadipate enol-lactonase
MPTAAVNEIQISYERSGTGPPLLFCNGSGSTLAGSQPLIEPFRARFDVVAHDQRGLGLTEVPPPPYTMAQYAADAMGLIDAAGWNRCRVVGISFGGMVAQELAVTWPERIERLALLCTSPGGRGGASYPLQDLADLPADERATSWLELLDTRFTPEWLATHPDDQALVEMLAGRMSAEPSPEAQRGEAAQMEARSHHDVYDRLPRITCPTFVASGRFDGIAPLDNGEAIARQVPGADLHVYEGGHMFIAQDGRAFPEILDFLAGPAG